MKRARTQLVLVGKTSELERPEGPGDNETSDAKGGGGR